MDTLLRVVKKGPQRPFGGKSGKHKKLPENWGHIKEPVQEGMTFYVKYLGSTLVEELGDGESYGDAISAEAVKTIVAMAKASGKKLAKMAIRVSYKGLKVTNMVTKEVFDEVTIYRISFCTADSVHDKVFAYIARNQINETMECHAFLCAKRKIAQAVTLTVAEAFNLALEDWQTKQKKERENHKTRALSDSSPVEVNGTDLLSTGRDSPQRSLQSGSSSDPWDSNSCSSSPQTASPQQEVRELCSPNDSVGETSSVPEATVEVEEEGFEDNFSDSDLDPFSSFALSRHKNNKNPFQTFTTGLKAEDVDEGVLCYAQGQQNSDQFTRTGSIEDLLCL